MTERETKTDTKAGPAKPPYEAPRIVSSEPIEALAGTCDTAGGGKQTGDPSCSVFRS